MSWAAGSVALTLCLTWEPIARSPRPQRLHDVSGMPPLVLLLLCISEAWDATDCGESHEKENGVWEERGGGGNSKHKIVFKFGLIFCLYNIT